MTGAAPHPPHIMSVNILMTAVPHGGLRDSTSRIRQVVPQCRRWSLLVLASNGLNHSYPATLILKVLYPAAIVFGDIYQPLIIYKDINRAPAVFRDISVKIFYITVEDDGLASVARMPTWSVCQTVCPWGRAGLVPTQPRQRLVGFASNVSQTVRSHFLLPIQMLPEFRRLAFLGFY